MATKKKVAVVGAGISGLLAIKSLKEEGFEPHCFEQSSYYGGLWKYHEEDVEGVPSVMSTTSFNNSKELGSISDYPPKPEYPNFMPHATALKMFTGYAEKFNLFSYIKYNHKVTGILRAEDYDRTGRWRVVIQDTKSLETSECIFDAVMVCIGHLSVPNIPDFPAMETFKGDVMHTHSLKKFHEFDSKRVCVVGTGSSALDAAVEMSHVASQVHLSIRTPSWIFTRHGPYGYPIDWRIFTWFNLIFSSIFPQRLNNKILEGIFLNPRFCHNLFNIRPTRGPTNRDTAYSDCISSRLMNGSIVLKNNIERFTENGVIFLDEGGKETELDIVVFGTGYRWEFPFLNPNDFITEGNKVNLFKCVYPPHLTFPTLGIIGFIVPLGPGIPCYELQCRWFAQVLKGNCKLPSEKYMLEDINKQYINNMKRFDDSSRVSIHVDYKSYTDFLASEIGAKPNMLKLFFTDCRLFSSCAFGPYLPYRFRLWGSHNWEGARQAILEADQRMRAPLQGKRAFAKTPKSSLKYYVLAFIFIVVLLTCFLFIAYYV